MPAWINIDESLVLARLSAPELNAFRTRAIQAGQADPLTEIIDLVVPSVRGAIGANQQNVLADGTTLPESALRHALAIMRVMIANRLPGMKSLIDDLRLEEWKTAERWLLSKPLVEQPDFAASPSDQIQGGNRPRITPRLRVFKPVHQDGI